MQPGAVAGAVLDLHAARARLGTYKGLNSPLTTQWFDTSGNANHGTLTNFAGTTASGWAGSGTVADPYRCACDGSNDAVRLGIALSYPDRFTLEAWFTASSFASYGGRIFDLAPTIFMVEQTTGRLLINNNSFGTYYLTAGALDLNTLYHVAWTWDKDLPTPNIRGYINNVQVLSQYYGSAFNPMTGLTTIGNRNAADRPLTGSIALARIYPFALTPAQVAQNYAVGTVWPDDGQIIFDGNSIPAGAQAHDGWDFPNIVHCHSGWSFDKLNLAVSGQTTQQMTADGVAQIDALHDGGRAFNIVVPWELRNDYIQNTLTPTQTHDHMEAYCAARQAAGWQVVLPNMPPTAAYDKPAGYDADRATINALIAADWATFADALVDMAAEPQIGPSAAAIDTFYWAPGGAHLTDLGQSIVAGLVEDALAALLPGTFDFSHPGPVPASDATADARSLLIGDDDVAALIDWDSFDRQTSEHGYSSLTLDIPIETQWEVASNAIVDGAAVVYRRNGVIGWEGTVAIVRRDGPDDPVLHVECRGYWAELSDREDYVKGFVDRDTGQWREYSPALMDGTWAGKQANFAANLTEGTLLLLWPKGSNVQGAAETFLAYWLMDGLDPTSEIRRVTAGYHSYISGYEGGGFYATPGIFSQVADEVPLATNAGPAGTADSAIDETWGVGSGYGALRLRMTYGAAGDLSNDSYHQLIGWAAYIDRTTAPRIDEAVYEGAYAAGVALSNSSSAVGTALSSLMWRDSDTLANHIMATLARYNAPVLCGIWAGRQMRTKPRPAAPDGTSRHWVVSAALQPGMKWGVGLDREAARDFVACIYGLEPTNEITVPTPLSTTWPSVWGRSSASYAIVGDYGGGTDLRFAVRNTADGHWAAYPGTGYLAVTASEQYFVRFRSAVSARTAGTAMIFVRWYNSGGATITDTTIYSATTADALKWHELTVTAPAGAVGARVTGAWSGGGNYTEYLNFKEVEFRSAAPAGTLKKVYYPYEPPGNDKTGLVTLPQATTTEALAVAQMAHSMWSEPYEGPVSGLVGECMTIEGVAYPVEEMAPWDWIENLDAPEGDRGPHMITAVHEAGGEIDITCGGDVAFFYEREIVERRGRYRGAYRVRTRGWKRVSFETWWHRRYRKYYKKHHKYPAIPEHHKKYKRIRTYGWREIPGRYQ